MAPECGLSESRAEMMVCDLSDHVQFRRNPRTLHLLDSMAIIIHVTKRIYNLMGGKHSRSGSFQNLLDYGIRLPLFNAIKLDSLLERQKTRDREDRLSLVVLPDPHARPQQHCNPSASGQNNV